MALKVCYLFVSFVNDGLYSGTRSGLPMVLGLPTEDEPECRRAVAVVVAVVVVGKVRRSEGRGVFG